MSDPHVASITIVMDNKHFYDPYPLLRIACV